MRDPVFACHHREDRDTRRIRAKKARTGRSIRRNGASAVTRLTTPLVSVARKGVTVSSGGKHLQEEPRSRCQQQDRTPWCKQRCRFRPPRDSKSPQASRRCECPRCQRASRKNGRQKIQATGSTVCKKADAMTILPSQEKRACGLPLFEVCYRHNMGAVFYRCTDWTSSVRSRTRATVGSCSRQSPTTASSTRQRSQTTAFSADCKAAQLMRSRLSRAKEAVSGKEIYQFRLS